MNLLLAVHGYPPELCGGTEISVRELARGLAGSGHSVTVVAGTLERAKSSGGFTAEIAPGSDVDPATGRRFDVLRLRRSDLYFDHWQKSLFPPLTEAFGRIVRERRPDVVHVHHWIRLSRDLVQAAARAGVPSVCSLHDFWTSCLIAFRVLPRTRAFCRATIAPTPCLACAQELPPRTPWLDPREAAGELARRQKHLLDELALARIVLVPSAQHARELETFLGLEPGGLHARAIPPIGPSAMGQPAQRPRRRAPPFDPGKTPLELACWGQVLPHKGIDLILNAFARLRLPARLHVAGAEPDPSYSAALRRDAARLDVRFHGSYAAEELAAHPVAAVHAMVSGSLARETHSLVVDEAIELGLPSILPAGGAHLARERVEEWALLYEPGDVVQLARAIERLQGEAGLLASLARGLPSPAKPPVRLADLVRAMEAIYREAAAQGAPAVSPAVGSGGSEDARREQEQFLRAFDEGIARSGADP
jgi:glycosyltransferase involved in cell wall biosynthesis